jgi:hypothetical protein
MIGHVPDVTLDKKGATGSLIEVKKQSPLSVLKKLRLNLFARLDYVEAHAWSAALCISLRVAACLCGSRVTLGDSAAPCVCQRASAGLGLDSAGLG